MIDNQINCETTEEHNHLFTPPEPYLSLGHLSSPPQTGHAVPNPTPNQPIQGVTGASYAPMDTTPNATPQTELDPKAIIDEMMTQFQLKLNLLVTVLQKQSNAQVDLEEAVDVALHNADWFDQRLEEFVGNHINDMDFDYEIGNQVERYMRNDFDPNDHVDFAELVNDRVDDIIDDMVQEAVDRHLEEHLSQLIEDRLTNATIRIDL